MNTKTDTEPDSVAAVILLISRQFLDDYFPQYRQLRFVFGGVRHHATLFEMHEAKRTPYDDHYFSGILLQSLYHLCQAGVTSRCNMLTVNEENERLKNILRNIDEHYKESLTQADIATLFYFTPQFFSAISSSTQAILHRAFNRQTYS